MRDDTADRNHPHTDNLGVDHSFQDSNGGWQDVHSGIIDALHNAIGGVKPCQNDVIVLRAGQRREIDADAELKLETGETCTVRGFLPPDLPLGYHQLLAKNGRVTRVIVAPERCYLPDPMHTWGWALQLYALRSKESWGMGDLEDLRNFAEWSARELGAGVITVNPLHTATPGIPQNPSPYFPSSRRFRNPLYLRIEVISDIVSEPLQRAARALNENRIIDRDSIYRLKLEALEALWETFDQDAEFDDFCKREGSDLVEFAAFCVLVERNGRGWQKWPAEFRHPNGPGSKKLIAEPDRRMQFHMWMQWHLDRQLARASEPLAIMQDLPIGVDPDGADAWLWQDYLAQNVAVGAPPDAFNREGQNWGLPPFIPHKLRAAGYDPFIKTIRASLQHAGGLRIDHVMGLFRLFWIPNGAEPGKGSYVRYNADELLAIVALESERAKAFIVGEDLGMVEDGVREALDKNRVLSYRLLWFEDKPPSQFPVHTLAAVTTHDLPTIAGVWKRSDLASQEKIGLQPNVEDQQKWRKKIEQICKSGEDIAEGVHREIATAPSCIVTATLDDALGVEERPNMPATLNDQWPNWSLALPLDLESIGTDETVRKVAAALSARKL